MPPGTKSTVNVVVPFDQRRDRTQVSERPLVESPDLVAYGMIVRVDQERAFRRMTGQMDLEHALRRHAL